MDTIAIVPLTEPFRVYARLFHLRKSSGFKFLIGIALLDTRFLKNENGENFVGAAGAFVTNDELATLRLDPEGIRVSPHGTFYISDEYGPYQVHCFHVVCESGRDLGAIYERYICRH